MEGNPRYAIDQRTLQMFIDVIQERPLKEVIHIYEAIKRLPVMPGGEPAPETPPPASSPESENGGQSKVPDVPMAPPPEPELPGIDGELAEFAKLSAGGRAASRKRRRRN